MQTSQLLIKEWLARPDAYLILNQVQKTLDEEAARRQEFYDAMEDEKVEFINGEIVHHSPVTKAHCDVVGRLCCLLPTFVQKHKLGYVGVEKILTKFTRNDYEPDICFFGNEKAKDFHRKQMIFPVPDLAVEVLSHSPKSLKRDKEIKFHDYQEHGVTEYWMIDAEAETVAQHILKDGKYELLLKSGEGHIECRAVQGFVIPIRSIFDSEENREVLKKILLG